MASYKSWLPKDKDVRELSSLVNDAMSEINKAFRSLTRSGLSQETASQMLPELGGYDISSRETLREEFVSRADFNREKSRLRRIIKAGQSQPRKNTVSFGDEERSQLTAFFVDDSGNPIQSQYARREESYVRTQQNRRNLADLAKRGIEFERKVVTNPSTGKAMYNDSRHKVTVLVPKTPSMAERYREVIQTQPSKAVTNTNVPEGGVIDLWGDVVPAPEVEKRHMSMETLRKATEVDARMERQTSTYFDNYRTLIDTTMPTGISDEIDKYIDEIQALPPSRRQEMYEFITDNEDDAGTIEYLYWDTTQSLPAKMQAIVNFWRNQVGQKLGYEETDDMELVEVSEQLEDFGYEIGGLYPIFAEFQRRRQDEPKGRWRKKYRRG